MSVFRVVVVCLALPSLALGDACEISIEGVTEDMTMEEVIAAWSTKGLERILNARPQLIRSKSTGRGPAPNVDVVAFRPPMDGNPRTGLLHLRWERYNDRGVLKIKAGYFPDMPRESGIYNQMEKWSLWPMIAERKKQCAGAADLRNREATQRCQDKPGHLVVDRRERAYEVKIGEPPQQITNIAYACEYQFNAGPGPNVTEEITVEL